MYVVSGLTDWSNEHNGNNVSDVDNLPYTTLVYGNGPGYVDAHPRKNLTNANTRKCSLGKYTLLPHVGGGGGGGGDVVV